MLLTTKLILQDLNINASITRNQTNIYSILNINASIKMGLPQVRAEAQH